MTGWCAAPEFVVGRNDMMLAARVGGWRAGLCLPGDLACPYMFGANREHDHALRRLGHRAGIPRMTASTFEMLGSMVQQHMSVLLFHGLLHLAHQQATESDTASDGESTLTETDDAAALACRRRAV